MRKATPKYQIDTCHYCGQSYHPMRVYVKGAGMTAETYDPKDRIYVCDLNIIKGEFNEIIKIEPKTECHDKATAEGWSYAVWLTPRR